MTRLRPQDPPHDYRPLGGDVTDWLIRAAIIAVVLAAIRWGCFMP